MKFFLGRYNYFFLLLLIFSISEIIVNPIGDFPLNDDWSYGKALYYSITDTYTIGNFGAMTLFTHLIWGMLFVKIFGFSFTVLRISTFVSVIISMFFLDKLIFKITKNKMTAFLSCLVLLLNPLYFNLSNTYMTDVNFNTLLILSCYCAFSFFETRQFLFLFLFFTCSVFLVLLRQFGVIVPFCFTMACLFLKEKKVLWFLISCMGFLFVYLSLSRYEQYLKTILPTESAYKFSSGVHFTDKNFWNLFFYNFKERYKILLVQLCIYIAPIAIFYLFSLTKSFKVYVTMIVLFLNVLFVYWFFKEVRFPYHNVFENIWLGPETFHESINSAPHNSSLIFTSIATVVKFLFTSITCSTLSFYILSLVRTGKTIPSRVFAPKIIFLTAFLFAYSFMIFITESYFDRYYIPLLTVALILMTFIGKIYTGNFKPASLLLLCFFYVSVFGTKDYLCWNRIRWEAYSYLKEKKQASAANVNGGFELNCWNDLKNTWWSDYFSMGNFDYLIQFKNEQGFRLLKEYEFQRYFPYKKDKINIFVKEAKD